MYDIWQQPPPLHHHVGKRRQRLALKEMATAMCIEICIQRFSWQLGKTKGRKAQKVLLSARSMRIMHSNNDHYAIALEREDSDLHSTRRQQLCILKYGSNGSPSSLERTWATSSFFYCSYEVHPKRSPRFTARSSFLCCRARKLTSFGPAFTLIPTERLRFPAKRCKRSNRWKSQHDGYACDEWRRQRFAFSNCTQRSLPTPLKNH